MVVGDLIINAVVVSITKVVEDLTRVVEEEEDLTRVVEEDLTKVVEVDLTKVVEEDLTKVVEEDITKVAEEDLTKVVEEDVTKVVEEAALTIRVRGRVMGAALAITGKEIEEEAVGEVMTEPGGVETKGVMQVIMLVMLVLTFMEINLVAAATLEIMMLATTVDLATAVEPVVTLDLTRTRFLVPITARTPAVGQ